MKECIFSGQRSFFSSRIRYWISETGAVNEMRERDKVAFIAFFILFVKEYNIDHLEIRKRVKPYIPANLLRENLKTDTYYFQEALIEASLVNIIFPSIKYRNGFSIICVIRAWRISMALSILRITYIFCVSSKYIFCICLLAHFCFT